MKIEFTPEQIVSLTQSAIEDLRPKIVAQAAQSVGFEIERQITVCVAEEIKKIMDADFKKGLAESLAGIKPAIVEQAAAAAVGLAKALTEAMIAQAVKSMTNDYQRRTILEKLMQG